MSDESKYTWLKELLAGIVAAMCFAADNSSLITHNLSLILILHSSYGLLLFVISCFRLL